MERVTPHRSKDLGLERNPGTGEDAVDAYRCIKCGYPSGDDWTQCKGVCPVQQSPHFDAKWLTGTTEPGK